MELVAFIHSKSVWVQKISLTVPARYHLDMWSLHCSQGCSVHTILRLHFDEGIPFSGICANHRLVNEDWLALGNMKSFDIQHTLTLSVEGVSQVWNGVATDNGILSYIADTLLISFQDKKCLMELKTKYSDHPNKCWESFTWNITHPLLKRLKRRCVSKP